MPADDRSSTANHGVLRPTAVQALRGELAAADQLGPHDVARLVDQLLSACREVGASDLHLQPSEQGLAIRWRVDGVLRSVGVLPAAIAPNVVARLKVLADLLTYRTEVPQEGRIRGAPFEGELRLSTFPTLYGEKAVVRMFAPTGGLEYIADLGLPGEIAADLAHWLNQTSGVILITGPAGSGKTTTAYAALRELARATGEARSLASLEDPIEVAVAGVAQSQANPPAGFDMATGLRFLLRQDPEVIFISEIRDRATAEVAFQASLTGHLVISTFHAGSTAAALGRLGDMGIEPYMLRSGILAIISQRLVRRLCDCAVPGNDPADALGLPVARCRVPSGCPRCDRSGYQGRTLLAEALTLTTPALVAAVLARADVQQLERLAAESGNPSLWQRGLKAVEEGITSPAEIRRVLGTPA